MKQLPEHVIANAIVLELKSVVNSSLLRNDDAYCCHVCEGCPVAVMPPRNLKSVSYGMPGISCMFDVIKTSELNDDTFKGCNGEYP